jgi:23S rRNA (cytidine1920-2'-O)/16S rRNA (cytidine1409-2'-O)-methyltransferase
VRDGGPIVALVKPQFEAGRGQVGRGGVVRDREVHRRVLVDLWDWCAAHGFAPRDLTASPIRGPAGNVEFFLHLNSNDGDALEADATVRRALAEAPDSHAPTAAG